MSEHADLPLASPREKRTFGFTLLEILVAVVLLATAFTIVVSTFTATLDGWRRSGEFLDRITHGDFVIDQMVASLRSAAFFPNRADKFGFWLDSKGGGDGPRDEISWVTSGSAFMLPEDPLAKGLYRIMITAEDKGLAIRSFQHMKKELDKSEAKPWYVSSRVTGLDCRVYNFEEEDWKDEWEDTNAVPSLVEITLFLEPMEKGRPPIKVQRIIEIPVAPAVTAAVRTDSPGRQTPGDNREPGRQPSEQDGAGGQAAPSEKARERPPRIRMGGGP